MSDPDNFLTRWSRRKREAAEESQEPQGSPDAASTEQARDAQSQQPRPADAAEPLVDLTKLPSIESITAETDISAFLAPGVPADLKLAALRRAWVADPKIRDFVGLNDYDFDFHTPGAIPGFGSLEMTDELRREVARIVGNLLPEDELPSETANSGPLEASPAAVHPAEAIAEINTNADPAADPAGPTSRFPSEVAGHLPEETHSKLAAMQGDKGSAASQQNIAGAENLQRPARRGHGGALPK